MLNKRDVELLMLCEREGVAPFNNELPNWKLVGNFVGRSNNAVGKQYRSIAKRCKKAGTDVRTELNRVSGGVVRGTYGCENDVPEVVTIMPDSFIGARVDNIHPIDQMVINAGLDPTQFEIKKGKMWGSPLNPMVSGTFERKVPDGKVFDDLMEKVSDIVTQPRKTSSKMSNNDTMAMFSLYDAHLSKLSHLGVGIETTADAYMEVLTGLIDKVIRYGGAKRANLVIGQDFGHSDIHSQTTHGTPQSVSVPFHMAVDKQVEVALLSIELLRDYFEEVEIIGVRGNHSEESYIWLISLINAVYKDVDNVTVDNGQAFRKYSSFGINSFMYLHGDKVPPARRPLLFATEAPILFSHAKTRTIFSGHLHSRKTDVNMISEEYGVVQRQMSALSDQDTWHEKSGYVLNKRMGSVLLYDYKKGLDAEFYYTVE